MNNLKRDSSDITPALPSAGHTNSRDDALARQLANQHGALLGPVLAEAAKKLRTEAIAKLQEQNARLTAAKDALAAATATRHCIRALQDWGLGHRILPTRSTFERATTLFARLGAAS